MTVFIVFKAPFVYYVTEPDNNLERAEQGENSPHFASGVPKHIDAKLGHLPPQAWGAGRVGLQGFPPLHPPLKQNHLYIHENKQMNKALSHQYRSVSSHS